MSNPNSAYNSGAVPRGGFFVHIKRPSTPEAPPGSPTDLGQYLVESLNVAPNANLMQRPNVDGGRNGWTLTNGDEMGSAVIQMNVATTPTLQNGDYFDADVFVDAGGAAVTKRCVIYNPSVNQDASYKKASCSIIIDQDADV